MIRYFVAYTAIDKDGAEYNRTYSTIYESEEPIEELKSLENYFLEHKHSGSDYNAITINSINLLFNIPDKIYI